MEMMDALVKAAPEKGLVLTQVPKPVPGMGEVLIKIHKTAICGTDVHIYNWNQWAQETIKPPMVIGHEYVGEIAELGPEDAVISDELNHASIIDGVRLCKAKRYRYKNNNMEDLRAQLQDAKDSGCKIKLIATDGVFSMDGYIANLKGICDLADEFDALVMVDDSHAVGFMGEHGRGTAEYCGVEGRVDIITGTLGKALGGASGGYTAARQEIVDLLRQRSRPYLFSNTVAPAICAAACKTIDMLTESTALRDKVHENARYFRAEMEKCGFDLLPGEHPIVPVMLYDPQVANEFAARMLKKGVYVVGFCYPVVPKGRDRIRTQISAGHTKEDLDFAVKCFREVKEEMGL